LRKSRPSHETREKANAPWALKVFILLHVIAITSWAMPKAAPAVLDGKAQPRGSEWLLFFNDKYLKPSPVQLYVLSTGLWQSWDMFSPNPASEDIWADADVYFKNGQVKRYQYPRMYALPIVEKYEKERYRKFFEHANTDENLWPLFAKRIAYMHATDPANPPVKVELHRHWYDVPRPVTFSEYASNLLQGIKAGHITIKVLLPDNPPVPAEYNDYLYYEYPVPPGKMDNQ
jgi:hypothetical protein